MAANDDVVNKILSKIEHENVVISKAMGMRNLANNPTVQAGIDAQVKAGQQNIKYLQEQLAQMQINQSSQGPRPRPNYSRLDLIKDDTPHLGPRYQLMLSQLIFKLDVEKKYKEGIEKVVRLYEFDGDKKSRQEAEGRRIECNQKIILLQTALRRYEDLNIGGVVVDEGNDDDSINQPQGRRPLSGYLTLKIHAVKDVQHALAGSTWGRKSASFVQIKVEDNIRGTTKQTKNDRWTEELHNIEVDKANEIEMTVYDTTSSSKYPSPIGMIWIRLSDVVEEMRRKKLEQEMAGSQWVTAEQMSDGSGGPGFPGQPSGGPPGQFPGHAGGAGGALMGGVPGAGIAGPTGSDPNMIESWFSLEPVGSIFLGISFVKENRGKPAFDLGLNRKGAVRQRKEEVQERYGHKFVSQQFFNIMRCALCGELLKYNAGMQCEDCRYLCHQKCYPKVVTKCISKSAAETDPDEVKINHRIPHRFDAFNNFSANWCCHCGYLLAVGKRNARKCSECGLTCHASCQHLVPDFCGLPMETANEIIARARGIPQRPPMASGPGQRSSGMAAGQSLRPALPPNSPSYASGPEGDRMNSPPPERASYQSGGYGGGPPNDMAAKAAGAVLGGMGGSSQGPKYPQDQQRPGMGQRQQSEAESAAKWAVQGDMRRPQSMQNQYGSNVQELPVNNPSHASYNPQSYANFENAPLSQQYPPYQQQPHQHQHQQQQQPQQQPQQQQQQQQLQQQQQGMSQMSGGAGAGAMVPTGAQGGAQASKRVSQQAQGKQSQRRIGLEHFNFLAVLGKGNFGKVMLAETKATKKLYAIKVLKKEFIIENDEVESTRSEKRVFLVANKERHPFLLNLHACFQTETRIYFVMEYISGGDLMLHIQRGQFGLKRSVFYASEVCLALKYFHENGVIYRDLKLDNILLTLDGHIKIADYGLCKEKMYYGDTTGTFCGTPEFMAPEILLDKKYGRAVDWWAFGVLIYQMLLQQSPFRGEDEDEIYDAILADEPLYPIHMPRDSVAVLQKLLTREPEHRLGSGPKDAQEIMDQPFFKTVNWDDVLHRRIPPPYLPQIKSATDTANFDSEFTSVTPVLTPVQSVLTQQMQEEFRGFSYTGDFE